MAVGTPNFASGDLCQDHDLRCSTIRKGADVVDLSANVIELKHPDILLAAVNTTLCPKGIHELHHPKAVGALGVSATLKEMRIGSPFAVVKTRRFVESITMAKVVLNVSATSIIAMLHGVIVLTIAHATTALRNNAAHLRPTLVDEEGIERARQSALRADLFVACVTQSVTPSVSVIRHIGSLVSPSRPCAFARRLRTLRGSMPAVCWPGMYHSRTTP